MAEAERTIELLRRVFSGDPWHGPSLEEALSGVDAPSATSHTIESAHSIWEIVLHLEGWTREVAKRLRGGEPTPPARGDWPEREEPPTGEAWSRTLGKLRAAHEELYSAIADFPESRLAQRVGGERSAPLGTGVTYREMIYGILQHDAYHAGQISLLKKVSRSGSA